MRYFLSFSLIALMALLNGCSTVNPYAHRDDRPGASVPQGNTPVPVVVADQPSGDTPSNTTKLPAERVPKPVGPAAFLLAEAERYQGEKNYSAAAVSIERAMRIDTGNPWLSLALAKVRVDQENPDQAEALAKRALARAGNDSDLSAQCWQTIAAARTLNGDHSGAERAMQQAGQSN